MIVKEKNAGEKIPYSVSKTKIDFDDGMLVLKLDRYQKDWPVHKDICMDEDGDLTMGVGEGLYYVAEIDIPAKEYEETEPDDEESVAAKALPLDMSKVVLTLWAIENPTPADDAE